MKKFPDPSFPSRKSPWVGNVIHLLRQHFLVPRVSLFGDNVIPALLYYVILTDRVIVMNPKFIMNPKYFITLKKLIFSDLLFPKRRLLSNKLLDIGVSHLVQRHNLFTYFTT